MNPFKLLLLAAYILIVLLAVTADRDFYSSDKRSKERSFMMQNRYGRADGKHVIITPRTDKFFLASRYGKRSNSVHPSGSLVYPVSLCGRDEDLSCAYTGVANLYRCIQRKPTNDEMTTSE